MPAGNGGAGIISVRSLAGDFDVQVDYTLLNWPANNRHTLRMGFPTFGIGAFGEVGPFRQSTSAEIYGMDTLDQVFQGSTSDTGGKLRLFRKGSGLTGYFYNGSNWTVIGGGTIVTTPTRVTLEFGSGDAQAPGGVTIAFDYFKVNAGTITCPP